MCSFIHTHGASNSPLLSHHSQFCKKLLCPEKDTPANPQVLWNAKVFPCRVHHLFFPPPLPKSTSFLRHRTAQGTQAAKSEFVRLVVFCSAIVSPVSLFPPGLYPPDFKYKATHSGVNAQKPKAPHQAAPASVLKGLWPRSNCIHPPPTPPHSLGPAFKACKGQQS